MTAAKRKRWACPGCGLERPAEVVLAAVTLDVPSIRCVWVPVEPARGEIDMLLEVVARRRLARKGTELEGCGLLWVTFIGGRRVWAAEAESLAELAELDEGARAPGVVLN